MEIKLKNYVPFLQEGGPIEEQPVEQAPVEQAPEQSGGDEMQQLLAACQQVLQTQDCLMAMQVIEVVMQMLAGGAPQEAAPEGQPVYRRGGKLIGYIKK